MVPEKQFDRNILKAFIDKQIYRCVTNKYYICGVLVSDTRKIKLVDNIFDDCLLNAYSKKVKQYRKSAWESRILFINGSYIECFSAVQNRRGNKYNALVIDSNMDSEDRDCFGYMNFLPYPTPFVLGDESVESVNKKLKQIKQINGKNDIIEINIE